MPTAFFLSKLRSGASAEEYERWVREFDYPTSRKLRSIKSYKVHKINGTLSGNDKVYDYIEVIDFSNLDEYRNDLASENGKKILAGWSKFIGDHVAVHGQSF